MSQNRSVAIIGAGQTGVSAAVGFVKAGFDVTLFSDRDRRSLRDDGPATGTAVTFTVAQAAERELGLDDYLDRAPRVTGQSTQVFSGSGADRETASTSTSSTQAPGRLALTPGSRSTIASTNSSLQEAGSSSRRSPPNRSTTWQLLTISRWSRRAGPGCRTYSPSITRAPCTTVRSDAC